MEMRARIFDAARAAFGRAGFDHVGLRQIATEAASDAAVIVRLFGSKEALFEEVAASAFGPEAAFEGDLATFGERVAAYLLHPPVAAPDDEFDDFGFLLHSATSPTAGPILSRHLHARFIMPLAEQIGAAEAEGRAALITAYILGVATLNVTLQSPALQPASAQLERMLAQAIQACVNDDTNAQG